MLLDNPWETCNGTLAFDRTRIPDPGGLIRQVHALGVRFMLWVSPKATCAQGYPAGRAARPDRRARRSTCGEPTSSASTRRSCASCVALGVDGVKGDRGDEVDLEDDRARRCRTSTRCSTRRPSIGALPPGAAAIFRAGDDGLAGRAAGDLGRRPARASSIGLQRAIRAAADGRR